MKGVTMMFLSIVLGWSIVYLKYDLVIVSLKGVVRSKVAINVPLFY